MLPAETHPHPVPSIEAAVAPPPASSWLEQLLSFLCYTVLPAVPRSLWLAGSGAVFSLCNLAALQEVWPNTPKAGEVFIVLFAVSGMVLPWLVGRTARRVAAQVQGRWWRLLWQLAYLGCYAGAVLLLLPESIAVFVFLTEFVFK